MSRYSDDAYSTTSSQWTTTYKRLPKKQPMAVRFLSWAAGAPPGATVVKKRTRDRDVDDSRSTRSGASSYFVDPYTQMYWVMAPEPRGSYHSSSGGSSRSSRSSKSSRSGKSSRHRAPAGPPAPPPMAPPPMNHNGFPPPPPGPPMGGHFVDDMGGPYPPAPPPMNVPPPMPMPPPPPMNGGAPAFYDVSGQNQPGNPFQHGHGPPGGFRGAHVDDDDDDESSIYSDE